MCVCACVPLCAVRQIETLTEYIMQGYRFGGSCQCYIKAEKMFVHFKLFAQKLTLQSTYCEVELF